jgi:hypothetical protein
MNENFGGYTMPAGWYIDSAGHTPVINWWNFNNINQIWPSDTLVGAGFDSSYINIQLFPPNNAQDYIYSLVSDFFNASALSSVYLGYAEFEGVGDVCAIDVTNDGGITWNTGLHLDGHIAGVSGNLIYGYRHVIDLSEYAAGFSNVRFRFRFGLLQGSINNTALWFIDSVVVADSIPCTTPADNRGFVKNPFINLVCPGGNVHLSIENLSVGIGQTYQWQYRYPFPLGNPWQNIPGAVHDTCDSEQDSTTLYRCMITCQSSTALTDSIGIFDSLYYFNENVLPINANNNRGICGNTQDTIVLSPDRHISGVTYQWSYAPASTGVYTNITNSNDSIYVVNSPNYTGDTYFRCDQICPVGGSHRMSTTFNVYLNGNPYCYCMPYNFNDCPPDTFGLGSTIRGVSITGTTLNNPNSGCNNGVMGAYNSYTYFPPLGSTTALLSRNTQYTLTVTNDTIDYLYYFFWIDYDHNGVFDSSEYTYIGLLTTSATDSANFTVPANAVPGLTGMRVRAIAPGDFFDGNSACYYYYDGETEDYMVTIDTTTGIKNINLEMMNVELFPNPAKDELTISSKQVGDNVQIKVTDVTGREIISQKKLTVNCKLKTGNLTPGIYFVKVQTGKGSVVKKFVKQ